MSSPAVVVVSWEMQPQDAAWLIPEVLTRIRAVMQEVTPITSVAVGVDEPARAVRAITENW